ncbi:MAG: carbon monoxide dehydrogenase subunit G [Pseudomonadota bacterium]
MELTGEHRIPAPRQKVWEALHDPDLLKECIKGCQKLEMVDESHMVAKVQAKVGPVKATFDANVEIVDPVAPERYTLVGEGKGGVAGFAKGSADVSLAEDGDETIMTYHAKANVGGKLAQLGSRLVDTTAKKYAADFFSAFTEKLSPQPAETGEPSPAVVDEGLGEAEIAVQNTAVDSPHAEDTAEREVEVAAGKGFLGGPWMWGIIAFAVVLIVLIALR